MRQGWSILLLFNIMFEVLVRAMRQKEYKMGTNRKEETKLFLLADSMSLCSKDNADTDRKHLDLINSLSKVADTNQHVKKNQFLVVGISDKLLEEKHMKTIHPQQI